MYNFSVLKKDYEEQCHKRRGQNLLILRKKIANITQDEFCEVLGIQKSNLSAIENGKKDLSLSNILAYKKYFKEHHGLDLSIDYLLGFTDKLENKSEEVCNQLGLSEESVKVLQEIPKEKEEVHKFTYLPYILDFLIKYETEDTGERREILRNLYDYLFGGLEKVGGVWKDTITLYDINNTYHKVISVEDLHMFSFSALITSINNAMRYIEDNQEIYSNYGKTVTKGDDFLDFRMAEIYSTRKHSAKNTDEKVEAIEDELRKIRNTRKE